MTKHTDGLNDRPNNDAISQCGTGTPADTGSPIDATDEEIARVRTKMMDDLKDEEQKPVQAFGPRLAATNGQRAR